jgi:hypothetical protein
MNSVDKMYSNFASAWLLIANLQDLIHKLVLVFLFPDRLHILLMTQKVDITPFPHYNIQIRKSFTATPAAAWRIFLLRRCSWTHSQASYSAISTVERELQLISTHCLYILN